MKDHIIANPDQTEAILNRLAAIIKRLHTLSIIHGDLTTSNMIYQDLNKIYLIDFGLACISNSV